MKAEVLTPWIGRGKQDDPYRPQIIDDYPAQVFAYSDTTGQPSSNLKSRPNLFVILVEADVSFIDELETNPDYEVMWREE